MALLSVATLKSRVVYMGTTDANATDFPDTCMVGILAVRGKYYPAARYVEEPYSKRTDISSYIAKRLIAGRFMRRARILSASSKDMQRLHLARFAEAFCENRLDWDTSLYDGFAFPVLKTITLVLRNPRDFVRKTAVYDLIKYPQGFGATGYRRVRVG